jgi:hypothetical protein
MAVTSRSEFTMPARESLARSAPTMKGIDVATGPKMFVVGDLSPLTALKCLLRTVLTSGEECKGIQHRAPDSLQIGRQLIKL